MEILIPLLFLFVFAFAIVKRVNVFNSFIDGAKQAIPLTISIFPYIATVLMAIELMKVSGVYNAVELVFSPALKFLGIPSELTPLIILRPFSGSGSLGLVNDVYSNYGVDSYAGRCASVLYGSTETVFYLSTIYFSGTSVKKLGLAIPIAIFCSVMSGVLACLFCKIM